MNSKYYYEYEWDSSYCYPKSHVLRNRLNIKNQEELNDAERAITSVKISQALITRIEGKFDFEHLKQIHRFLFATYMTGQDVSGLLIYQKGMRFAELSI